MASILLPRHLQAQPQYPVEIDYSVLPSGGEVFTAPAGFAKAGGGPATVVGPAVVNQVPYAPNVISAHLTSGADRGLHSPNVSTPPLNVSVFAVARSIANFNASMAQNTLLCGFNKAEINAAYKGGNASIGLHFGLDEFGVKVCGASLTYSDATSENVTLAGGVSADRGLWFVGASYTDQSNVILVARNLLTGQFLSSKTTKTKALQSVAQNFQILSSMPYLTTSYAAACRQSAAYVGWVPKAFSVEEFAEISRNPWQIFRPQRRILYFDVGGAGTNTYTYSGDADITFSGTATTAWLKLYSFNGDADITFSGAATTAYVPVGSTTYSYSGDGSITFSGTATTAWLKMFSYAGSGTLTFSGDATTDYVPGLVEYAYDGSGTIVFSGAAETSGPKLAETVGGGIGHGGFTRKSRRLVKVEEAESPEEVIAEIERAFAETTKKPVKKRAQAKVSTKPVETPSVDPDAWLDYFREQSRLVREQQMMNDLLAQAKMRVQELQAQETLRRLEALQIQQEEEVLLLLMAA